MIIFEQTIEKFGVGIQLVVAMEECAELMVEICNNFESNKKISSIKKSALKIKGISKKVRKSEDHNGIKIKNIDHNETKNIREEMADVGIMLAQLEFVFGGIYSEYNLKLKKLRSLIGE